MLLIGDIHMTSKMKDQICDSLEAFVQAHSDEQHIVLVGDFVYHFSYDRGALMQLYGLLVQRYQQGKTIYVVAGNHDRLGSHFVFAEAKAAFDLLNQHTSNQLYFITQPEVYLIEGKRVLFLPYMLDVVMPSLSDRYESGTHQALKSTIDDLLSSNHTNEQLSGKINAVLLDTVSRHSDELLVIHHYYIAQTVFPGMRSQFSYKDVALSPLVLELDRVRLISGHLHQPFVHRNYLCVGSRRHTSPLETQQYKIACQFDLTHDVVNLAYHHLNPYMVLSDVVLSDVAASSQSFPLLEDGGLFESVELDGGPLENPDDLVKSTVSRIGMDRVSDLLVVLDMQMMQLLESQDSWNVVRTSHDVPALDRITLTIQTNSSKGYADIAEFVDQELIQRVRDIKLKKTSVIDTQALNLHNPGMSLRGRQEVLTSYLRGKYPDTYERYEDMLRNLQVIS